MRGGKRAPGVHARAEQTIVDIGLGALPHLGAEFSVDAADLGDAQRFTDQHSGVDNQHVDTIEAFGTDDGSRVTSRWMLTGTNNGVLGTEPNGKPVAMTGTAIWTVDDEKLQRGWIEQASFELYNSLLEK